MRFASLLLAFLFFLASEIQETTAQDSSPDTGGRASPPLTEATLCIHNGGDTFANGPFHGYPNEGGGKYFPSFTHWTATSMGNLGQVYPWKIRGWGWAGMQGALFGPAWYWESCLQKSMDSPYATTMTWPYPVLFCTGTVPHYGPPGPVYSGSVPTTVPSLSGNLWIYPDSNGFDKFLNIFATGIASWAIPSTQPFYAYEFGISFGCASALTVPSHSSIWEYLWNMKGPFDQYLVVSNDESDCLGGPGNKGRNYSLIRDWGAGYFWYWQNGCAGGQHELAMCLFVCDAVTIPAAIPGSSSPANPFAAAGFDLGTATLTPYMTSNCAHLGFMTEDGSGIGGGRIILASFGFGNCVGPYGQSKYRIPHGFDMLTNLFLGIGPMFIHMPAPGYPACMFGTTTGGHSAFIPFPANPALMCAELRFASYPLNSGMPMSASYLVTYF